MAFPQRTIELRGVAGGNRFELIGVMRVATTFPGLNLLAKYDRKQWHSCWKVVYLSNPRGSDSSRVASKGGVGLILYPEVDKS